MGFFSSKPKEVFPWINLSSSEQLHELMQASESKPVLLFKHSTRCSISSMVLNRFEQTMDPAKATCVYLDLLVYRPISAEIEALTRVQHQSPQAILIRNREVIYSESHTGISAAEILKLI
mgnify:CR=1 FL=1|jgi:bacillithiol system protein YtxJ